MDFWRQRQPELLDAILPSSPQTLTFGYRFNLSPQGFELRLKRTASSDDYSDIDLQLRVQPELARYRAGAQAEGVL